MISALVDMTWETADTLDVRGGKGGFEPGSVGYQAERLTAALLTGQRKEGDMHVAVECARAGEGGREGGMGEGETEPRAQEK